MREGRIERRGKPGRIIASSEELELFRRRYDKYPRSVLGRSRLKDAKPQPRLLSKLLKRNLIYLFRSPEAWRGMVISVEEGDGMTWSAAAADRLIEKRAPALRRRRLTPELPLDGLPHLVKLIPKRRLALLAQQTKVAPPLESLRRRSVLLAALGLLAVGGLAAMLQWLMAIGGGGSAALVLGGGALLATILFAGQEISVRLKRSQREADEDSLLEALNRAPEERRGSWKAFVEALSAELRDAREDRAVIVDGYDRLDLLTRETLCHYLLHRQHPSHARELWIVFEDAEIESLAKELRVDQLGASRSLFSRMEMLRQTSLTEAERAELAREVGHPERARFHLVKSIARSGANSATAAQIEILDNQHASQRQDERAYGPLEIAYLLAVNQTKGALAFRESALISALSSDPDSAHREVLRLLLPTATFNRSEVADAIGRLEPPHQLSHMLDAGRLDGGEIELVGEAVDLLLERGDRYGLPAEEIVHLFWALYWYSRLGPEPNPDGYRLRKLARHLISAAAPGALGPGIGQAVRDRYREAAIWTARELLAASLPNQVHALLLRADRETSQDKDRGWLRSVCWQAYALLGDEDLLAMILRLHPGEGGPRSTAPSLESLFVESLRLPDAELGSRSELLERLPTLDPEIVAYTRVRGLWLAMTLEGKLLDSWPALSALSPDPAAQAAALVREALARLDDPTRPRAAIAAAAASLGTWCYAVGFFRSRQSVTEVNDFLEDVWLHAAQLHEALDERRQRGASENYVLRALAHEIELVAAAVATLAHGSSAMEHASEEERRRLEDHIRNAVADSGADEIVLEDWLAQGMGLQTLTWASLGYSNEKPLGFEQLAAFMSLRHAQLMTIVRPRSQGTVELALDLLAGQLDERGIVGLMSHLIAMRGSPSEEIVAVLWTRAVELVVDSGFGEELEAELCLIAFSICHGHEPLTKREGLEPLLRRDESGRTSLSRRLQALNDRETSHAALWLVNTAGDDGVEPDIRNALMAEVVSLRDRSQSETTRDEIQQLIELQEIERGAKEGRPIDSATVLAQWKERDSSSHYAWLLYLLFQRKSQLDADTVAAAATFLERHPEEPETTAPLVLAYDLAYFASHDGEIVSERDRETALAFLRRIHPSMASLLEIEANLNILRLLVRYSDDRDRYAEEIEIWEAARQQRDGLRKLPALAEVGKFFLVVWHYYETLFFFGLRTNPQIDVPALIPTNGHAAILAEWRAAKAAPPAMVRGPAGPMLSGDFLRYGRALFGAGAEDPDLDDARDIFNEAAFDALPVLFEHMTSLDSLPKRIRVLLDGHRAQLLRGSARS
jgi:hypothetical protein